MPTNPGPPSDSAHASTSWQWTAVAIIGAGCIIGGIALIEWNWPTFWTGVAVMVAGVVIAWRAHIMDAVSEWSPSEQPTSAHTDGRL
jgi:hypothetical protein